MEEAPRVRIVEATERIPSVDELLENPSRAEAIIHAKLMQRALKWLFILEQDDKDAHGKPLFDLSLQVEMFKVIAEWLKTSKRTKGEDDDKSALGIDQMRELIAEEVGHLKANRFQKAPENPAQKARVRAAADALAAHPPKIPDPTRSAADRRTAYAPNADSSKLDAILARGKQQALIEDEED